MPRDFTFLNPQAGFLLLAVPLIILLFFFAEKKRRQALTSLASLTMLDQIAALRNPFRSFLRMVFFLLFWIFACLALMNPVGNEHFKSQLSKAYSQEIYLLLDASASMTVTDTPAKISRFDYAKEIADLAIKKLRGSDMALATFTTGITIIVPPTHDAIYLRIRLKDLEINEGGNLPGTNFLNTLKELKNTNLTNLLLFSDGGDVALEGLADKEKALQIAKIVELINARNFPNVRIDAIGIGSLQGGKIPQTTVVSKLESALLQALSKSTGGNYYSASEFTAEAVADMLVQGIRQQMAQGTAREILSTRAYDEYFQIPLFLSIASLLLYLIFPVAKRPLIGIFAAIFLQSLNASEEDFAARQLFETGEYAQAYSRYQNLLLESSEEFYPLINYNLGTILLAENKPWQAASKLEAIPWADGISSNVKRRALINLAAAYDAMQRDSNDVLLRVHYLKKALQALGMADSLDCDKEHCLPSSDLGAIKKTLGNQINALAEESLENRDLFALLWHSLIFSLTEENAAYPSFLVNNRALWQKLLQTVESQDQKKILEEASTADPQEALAKFKEFLYLYYEPSELLLTDLQRLYALEGSKSLLLFLLQKAALSMPELQSAETNLALSQKEHIPGNAQLLFLNSKEAFQKALLSKNPHLVKKALLSVIEEAKVAVQKEILILRLPDLKSEKTQIGQNVLAASRELPQAIYEWQVLRFKQGVCQCKPWNEVFPLLRKGNDLWEKSAARQLSYWQIADQQQAIEMWLKALSIIENVPEGPEEASKNASAALNELQKMQLLDKQPSKPQKMPQGGKFW